MHVTKCQCTVNEHARSIYIFKMNSINLHKDAVHAYKTDLYVNMLTAESEIFQCISVVHIPLSFSSDGLTPFNHMLSHFCCNYGVYLESPQ